MMISTIALSLAGLVGAEAVTAAAEAGLTAPVAVSAPAAVAEESTPAQVVARPGRKLRDTSTTYDRYGSWQFGLSGGNSTGGGLAVRHWFNDKNGVEVHGYVYLSKRTFPADQGSGFSSDYGSDGYYYGDDTGTVAEGQISIGVQYLHEVLRVHLFDGSGLLKGGNHLRGLTFVGIGGYADFEDRDLRRGQYTTDYSEYPYKSVYSVKLNQASREMQNLLGGAGAGVELELSRFSIHFMVGYGGFYGLSTDTYELGPTVDGGLFVRF